MGVGVCFHKIKIRFLFSINSLTQKGLEFVPFSRNAAFSEPHPTYWVTPLLRLHTPEWKCFKEALSEHRAPSPLATGSPSRCSFQFCIFVMICEPNKTWVMSDRAQLWRGHTYLSSWVDWKWSTLCQINEGKPTYIWHLPYARHLTNTTTIHS